MTFAQVVETCLAEIKNARASLIYCLGAGDTGKSTLAIELARQLTLGGKKLAIIDADSGQSSRLPLTLSLNYVRSEFSHPAELELADWAFMPSYDLLERFKWYIELMENWTKKTRNEMDCCIVDSNGDIRTLLKARELEILNPDLLIALQREAELEEILKSSGSRILRLPVPEEVKSKSWELRRTTRNDKFKRYFKGSGAQVVKCKAPPLFDFGHRIVGLYSQGGFLGLGIAEDKNGNMLVVRTPIGSVADKIEFSSVKFEE
jgi:polynucleotide 5'-kinase involved in rRNA processing